jgi:predicted DNA-binding transcriptional regulator AlpA
MEILDDELLKLPHVLSTLKVSKAGFYQIDELVKLRIKIGRSSYWSKLAIQEWIARKREQAK